MTTFADPAVWLVELFDTYWSQAVESLRSEGKLVSSNKPAFKPTGRRDATGSIQNALTAKLYQATDESTSRVTHGDLDEDAKVAWAWKFTAGGEYQKARTAAREAAQVAHRLLLLYRSNPHPEWNRIESISTKQDADYADYQSQTVQFTLLRYGEVIPTKQTQVST